MEVSIRSVHPDDTDECIELAIRMWHETVNYEVFGHYDRDILRHFFETHLEWPLAGWVAVEGETGKIIGGLWASVGHVIFGPELVACQDSVYVDEEYRDAGVGAMLINQYLLWARSVGCKAADMDITSGLDMDGTVSKLEHMGFHKHGVTMQKVL